MIRPLTDYRPAELVRRMAPTTRRYALVSALALSPDARTLAYISDRSGTYAVWGVRLDAPGEPFPLLAPEGAAAEGIAWSSRGELVAAADRGGTERWQLWSRDANGVARARSVSDGDRVQHLLSWNAFSPDGTALAYSSNARTPGDVDVVVARGASPAVPCVAGPAWHRTGGWSPDGRSLAVVRVHDNLHQDLLVVDPASGAARAVTPAGADAQHVPAGWLADGRLLVLSDDGREHLALVALDPATGAREIVDAPEGDVELAVSSADGRVQVWSVNDEGRSRLRWRDAAGRRGERVLGGVCEDLVVSADGAVAAFVRSSATEPAELWTLEPASGVARCVHATTARVPREELVEPASVRIPGPRGAIHAFVYRPRGARGPVPAVLYPHGGPESQSRPAYDHVLSHLQALVGRGIAVVVPNIHGSTGYGRSWQGAIYRDWGGADFDDLRAVADWMAADPGIDPRRLAVYGGSYGGFAALSCLTRLPERWCAGVDLFGVANLVTMIEHAQPSWRRFLARWIGELPADRDRLTARSPVTHLDAVRCPVLVIQGANDPRVPSEESDQVVGRLRALGRPVDELRFPDEGHGFTKRANAERAYALIVEWLASRLQAS